MKRFILSVLALLAFSALALAEPDRELLYKVEYWVANIRAGISYPTGDSATNNNPGFNIGISARKGLDREILAGGSIIYATLTTKKEPNPGNFGATILMGEVAYTPFWPDFVLGLQPYFKGGLGVFLVRYPKQKSIDVVEMGSETAMGFSFGGGLNYPINKMIAVNFDTSYAQVATNGGTGNLYSFLMFGLGTTLYLK